jgi:PadR family transcriptional regulator, regulatory protein PadR
MWRMATDTLVTQMRKGALEYCVLALLAESRRYGFELVQVLGRIDGMLTSEGTIYPLLTRLRRDGLVDTEWEESTGGPPRRYYRSTAKGKAALGAFRDQWTVFRTAVDSILGSDKEGA